MRLFEGQSLSVESILSPKQIRDAKEYASDKTGSLEGEKKIIDDAKEALKNEHPNDATNYLFIRAGGNLYNAFKKFAGPSLSDRMMSGDYDDYIVDAYTLLWGPGEYTSPLKSFNTNIYMSNVINSFNLWYGSYAKNMLYKKYKDEIDFDREYNTTSLDRDFGSEEKRSSYDSYITSAYQSFTGAKSMEDEILDRLDPESNKLAKAKKDDENTKKDEILAKIKDMCYDKFKTKKGRKTFLEILKACIDKNTTNNRDIASITGKSIGLVNLSINVTLPDALEKFGITKAEFQGALDMYNNEVLKIVSEAAENDAKESDEKKPTKDKKDTSKKSDKKPKEKALSDSDYAVLQFHKYGKHYESKRR